VNLSSFFDELGKIASVAGRMASGLAGAAGNIAVDPYLRAEVGHIIGSKKRPDWKPPRELIQGARRTAQELLAAGVDPSKARIAIAGTGGTGKSTLAKELAKELAMRHRDLDWEVPADKHFSGLATAQKDLRLGKGEILEQIHLINNLDPDKFDALVRVHKPLPQVRKQLLARGRGAMQGSFTDYPKLQAAVQKGFEATKGQVIRTSKDVDLKIKPPGGFQADRILNRELRQKGIDPRGLERHQKVLSAVEGRKVQLGKGGGHHSYMRVGPFARLAASAAAGALGGASKGMHVAIGSARYQRQRDIRSGFRSPS
jgi:hypothetical protein